MNSTHSIILVEHRYKKNECCFSNIVRYIRTYAYITIAMDTKIMQLYIDLKEENDALKKENDALKKEIAALKGDISVNVKGSAAPAKPCKSGHKCNEDGAPVASPTVRPCKFGSKCNNKQCKFDHGSAVATITASDKVARSTYMNKTPCRDGACCKNPKCGFYHADGRPVTPPRDW